MKTNVKTIYPPRRCQNFNHWALYIKETVQKIKLKQKTESESKNKIVYNLNLK
jgi:hypothetical protein